uniref:Uncharacterized protein n=1 Tax=Hemiselmis andersenii TaxID=464988 RepID=A0A7S0TVH2_HEMAN
MMPYLFSMSVRVLRCLPYSSFPSSLSFSKMALYPSSDRGASTWSPRPPNFFHLCVGSLIMSKKSLRSSRVHSPSDFFPKGQHLSSASGRRQIGHSLIVHPSYFPPPPSFAAGG